MLDTGASQIKYKKIILGEAIPLKTPTDIRKLYDDFIAFEIRRDNSGNLPDGKIFRKDSVDIITETQKVLHQGIFPEDKTIQYMEKAIEILHDEQIPIFIRISIFHYMFGYIHPFYDGNGRMSRFITSYYIAKEIHPAIALRLSLLIKIQKNVTTIHLKLQIIPITAAILRSSLSVHWSFF